MNDTHPTLAVAELMRILLDDYQSDLGRGMGRYDEVLCVYEPHDYGGGS
jgi:glucan phosphorylase